MKNLLYAGSFDPVTRGHMDIITRASALCDRLVVAVMINPEKRGAIPREMRVSLLKEACAGLPNVEVVTHSGLLVDCARENGVDTVVRGLRPTGDFDSEYQMASVNRMLGGVETIMLITSPENVGTSSSVVRQVAAFGGDISRLVPEGMAGKISEALARRGE